MCRFKSGLAFKTKIVLAPEGNESHSNLLQILGIEDNHLNASKTFVRIELTPPNGDKTADINTWVYKVDQDIVPEWYEKDPGKYEEMFREEVREYLKGKFVVFAGHPWIPIKTDGDKTYYLFDGILESSMFSKQNNNYTNSIIRDRLNNGELAKALKEELGDKLVSITTDLLSLDGLDDYGKVEGDILAIPTLDLYRECRKNIPVINKSWWLATPDSTPSGYGSDDVRYVGSDGCVGYGWDGGYHGVRPFFILQS